MANECSEFNTKNEKGGTFLCENCGLRETYHYYGQQPPFHRGVTFLEDCYFIRDPFQSQANCSLLLGSECTSCSKVVCQAASCSLYYSARYCVTCAEANQKEFPREMQQRISKMQDKKC
ncbi:Cysteine-rich DPF motif domain-containing protein 1 [Portunus trituberculatus]|uniref:Cysteine-rich DPF motif domain-containing protein 1 n=1 Tax=Portunus trituberculatus TaxID=210409 RepID=A0A5B7IS45_PORTR|nr:Cysteine-rich DPF motif domain-containing protein 1 [Portunus trituberculatus]